MLIARTNAIIPINAAAPILIIEFIPPFLPATTDVAVVLLPELGMAIMFEHRGQGIGKRLLLEMIEFARSIGYSALSLSVDPHNKPALQMYEKSGFKKIYEDDGGSWTMKKDL